jgi:hypothetical protein
MESPGLSIVEGFPASPGLKLVPGLGIPRSLPVGICAPQQSGRGRPRFDLNWVCFGFVLGLNWVCFGFDWVRFGFVFTKCPIVFIIIILCYK